MTKATLTVDEARRYGTLATAAALVTGAVAGAGALATSGPGTALVVAGLVTAATVGGALGTVRLLVTLPQGLTAAAPPARGAPPE